MKVLKLFYHSTDDPLWHNRTIVRPSTSFAVTKNSASFLNPDSTVDASQLSEKWYANLTRSDSSKLMEQAVKKTINNRLNNGNK